MSNSWDRVQEERKKLVKQIIDNMKKGYVLPKPGWNEDAFAVGRIHNPVSHARYRGVNLVRLYIDQMMNKYEDGRYMTYKQAQSQGWQVKKGAVGIRLEKYLFDKIVEEKNEETGEIEKKRVRLRTPIVNQFVVFHASQIEGIPELEKKELEPLQPDEMIEMAEQFIKTSECPIVETNEGKAYYSPVQDEIHLPYRDAFLDTQSFLATQLHEMIHSTGHPNRLNRDLSGRFGSESYAREELRAELGSFFIQTDLGLDFDAQHFNSHTQYLESWISVLENDPNELFRAISDAQKASDYLEQRYERVKKLGARYIDEPEINSLLSVKGWERFADGSSQEKARKEAEIIAAGYQMDKNNYYRVSATESLEYPLTVQKITDGVCGFEKQCKSVEEVQKFVEAFVPDSTNRQALLSENWTESRTFEKLKIYTIKEFDSLMKQADAEWVEKRQQELAAYGGNEEAVWDAYDRKEIDSIHLGYEKTSFTIHMPDGTTIEERQDIGDGYGGVIDYLKQVPAYKEKMEQLEKSVHGEQLLTNQEAATVRMAVKRERRTPGAGEQHIEAWINKKRKEYKDLGLPFPNDRQELMMRVYLETKDQPVKNESKVMVR